MIFVKAASVGALLGFFAYFVGKNLLLQYQNKKFPADEPAIKKPSWFLIFISSCIAIESTLRGMAGEPIYYYRAVFQYIVMIIYLIAFSTKLIYKKANQPGL
ncbi:MAG: hypothetical protein ACRCYY_05735, partial [Trueperaceae bacterium]